MIKDLDHFKRVVMHLNSMKLYRFLDVEEHANNFAKGQIFVSTLNRCREHEDPKRRDSGEAIHMYNSGAWTGDGQEEHIRAVSSHLGIDVSESTDITLQTNTSRRALPDAYVLCATSDPNPDRMGEKMGPYCIEISSPLDFGNVLFDRLRQLLPLEEKCAFDQVQYKPREHEGLERPPGKIGFVKPIHFAPEAEWRWLFMAAEKHSPQGLVVDAPEAAQFLRRIA